jgi:high-affinity iron transporter
MLEALIVTLREGVEAALVVGIIVAFLRREGAERYLRAVWTGIGTAAVASFAGAFILYRWAVDEEVFEGLLYLGSAVIVGSMMVWMWRHAQALSGEMKGSLSRILAREKAGSVSAGLFLFTFLMVFREGIETVLFLSALSLTTGGLMAVLGVGIGLAAAVAFGVYFVRGSLRIDLGRFFKITGIALGIFVLQLLINGYHELSEAGWVPANETTMATIGPLVRNEFFFIAAVLLLPLLMLMIPGRRRQEAREEVPAAGAEGRLARAQAERQGRARLVGAVLGVVILAALGFGFVYTRPPAALSLATPVTSGSDGTVRIPLSSFQDGKLQRFALSLGGVAVRFIAVPVDAQAKEIATAFDACDICGAKGYFQDGTSITCLHCGSAIYPPSIGQSGGCNPAPLPARREGGDLVIAVSDLAKGAPRFAAGG